MMGATTPSLLPRALERWAERLMALALAGMVVAVFTNVVLRYGFGTGITFYEELSRLLFVWLVALGAVLASARGQHLGFDMLTVRLKGWPARVCHGLSRALVALCLVLVVKGSWHQVLAGLQSYSTVMGYPLALAAASTLLMAAAMAALLVLEVVRGVAPAHDTDAGVE